METRDNKDILCTNLLEGLNNLEVFLDNPTAQFAFDTHRDPRCVEKFDELKRLRRSLEQYSQKSSVLQYVGFVGHFSAGKSTTINTLLKDNPNNTQRSTGLHPTDTAVTLLTHPDNSGCLIGSYRRGDLEVGSSFVNCNLLQNAVVVDTPGSGDPSLVDEMVRDFLPVCDVIIYSFSAATPLDKSEIPILQKAHADLPFIPIRYIITRANEFIVDRAKRFAADNFDRPGADAFVAEFISRLSAAVPGLSVHPRDILLIDNIDEFNTENLAAFVLGAGTHSNGFQALHGNKITYYLRAAAEVRNFFVAHLQKKINDLTSLLKTARENHEQYQKVVTIGNSRLTESWIQQQKRIQQRRIANTEWVAALQQGLPIPSSVRLLESVAATIKRIFGDLSLHSQDIARGIDANVTSKLEHIWGQYLAEQKERVMRSDMPETVEIIPMRVEASEFLTQVATRVPPPTSVVRTVADIPGAVVAAIQRRARGVGDDCARLAQAIRERRVVESATQSTTESADHLSLLLSSFFQSVQVYKAAVVSLRTRDIAERLGLGHTIDELDQAELTEQQQRSWESITVERILPNRLSAVDQANKVFAEIQESLSSVQSRSRAIEAQHANFECRDVVSDVFSSMDPSTDQAFADVVRGVVDRFNTSLADAVSHVKVERSTFADRTTGLGTALREIQNMKTRRALKWSGVGCTAALLVVAGKLLWNRSLPANWGPAVATSVVATIICSAVGWILSKVTDKSDTLEIGVRQRYVEESREALRSSLGRRLEFILANLGQPELKIQGIIMARWRLAVEASLERIIGPEINDTFSDLRQVMDEFLRLRNRYILAVRELLDSLAENYSRRDENLSVLAKVSEEIRNEAILPSFSMFEERNRGLADKLEELRSLRISVG